MPIKQQAPRPGEVVANKYEIVKVLGTGGMGTVLAARHLQLNQMVALKFLLPEAVESATVLERFFREAQAAFRLSNEHVARVLDVGSTDAGAPYIVMEYLAGTNLADLLAAHRVLPVPRVVDYVLQAGEAIAEAHALGIVHRDLKPANLFLTTRLDGTPLVKVLDFGISKLSAELVGQAQQGALTKTGRAVGSPHYMAPEQMTAPKTVDRRADVWALGVVLYELSTGRLPFFAQNLPDLCLQIVRGTPPPLEGPGVPPGFPGLVARCLEKEPAKRFQDVGELAEALALYSESGARTSLKRIGGVSRMVRLEMPGKLPTAATTEAAAAPESGDDIHIDIHVTGERAVPEEFALSDTMADGETKPGV